MAANRFTKQRVQPEFIAEPLQDKLALPLLDMKRKEETMGALSDLTFGVEATEQDMKNGVAQDIEAFKKAREEATGALMRGNTSQGVAKLQQIRREWDGYMNNPSGRGYQAQRFYQAKVAGDKEYKTMGKDHSGKDITRGLQSAVKGWQEAGTYGAIVTDEEGKATGDFRDFADQAVLPPKYYNVEKEVQNSFRALGHTKTQGFMDAMNNGDISLVNVEGVPMFKMTGRTSTQSNKNQVDQRTVSIMNEWLNGPKAESAEFMQYTPEKLQEIIRQVGNSALKFEQTVDPNRYQQVRGLGGSGAGGGADKTAMTQALHSVAEQLPGVKEIRAPGSRDGYTGSIPTYGIGMPYEAVGSTAMQKTDLKAYEQEVKEFTALKNLYEFEGSDKEFAEAWNFVNKDKQSLFRLTLSMGVAPTEAVRTELHNISNSATYLVPGASSPLNLGQLKKHMLGVELDEDLTPEQEQEFEGMWAARKAEGYRPTQGGFALGLGNKSVVQLNEEISQHHPLSQLIGEAVLPKNPDTKERVKSIDLGYRDESGNPQPIKVTPRIIPRDGGGYKLVTDIDMPAKMRSDIMSYLTSSGQARVPKNEADYKELITLAENPQTIARWENSRYLRSRYTSDLNKETSSKNDIDYY